MIGEEQRAGFMLERLVLERKGSEPAVPAYFVRPHKAIRLPPVFLHNQAHGGDFDLGKDDLLVGRR